MIGGRLLQIVQYMEKHPVTSYREIAEELQMKERQIRYDVDRINDILMEHGEQPVERKSKGSLVYQGKQPLTSYFHTLLYSSSQRLDFIMLQALFDTEHLNMRKLSEDFEVSRSSIKNDIHLITDRLQEHGCVLRYEQGFLIRGDSYERMDCMVREFTRYIYMYGRSRKKFNAYEQYAMQILSAAYKNRDVKAMITWVKEFLEEQHIVMTDASFRWYVASSMVIFWYILHETNHPLFSKEEAGDGMELSEERWKKLEDILQCPIEKQCRTLILRYLNYTNRYHRPMKSLRITCSRLVSELIAKMAIRTGFNFGNDEILFEGLMNHLQPLLQRMQDHIHLIEQELPLLSKEEEQIVEQVQYCMEEIEELSALQKTEAVYLAMHFIAGLRRRDSAKNKRVLLVCGLGYAMLKLVQETLQSEFQIEIIDTIPSYKLQTYESWDQIDLVLSVMNVEIECAREIIILHPFLSDEDYIKLTRAGVKRKRLLPNLFGIYSSLDFLEENDRSHVMEVMKQELGLRNVRFYKRLHSLRDILRIPDIHIHRSRNNLIQLFSLEEAVNAQFSANDLTEYPPLWNEETCHLYYTQAKEKVKQTKMVLSITEQEEICFCILSTEDLFQIPATHELLQLLTRTSFISRARKASCVEELYQILLYCESSLHTA